MMKKNVGGIDRTLRIIVGLAILGAGLFHSSPLALLGLVPLGTGLVGICPLYIPVGLSTCPVAGSGKK